MPFTETPFPGGEEEKIQTQNVSHVKGTCLREDPRSPGGSLCRTQYSLKHRDTETNEQTAALTEECDTCRQTCWTDP